MVSRRFVWRWLAGTLGLLALTVLVNLVVDPYGIFGWVNIEGFNRNKTQAVDESRMVKPYLVERAHPKTLLIGSSRIEAGLDPASPVWPQALRPVFDLGIPGTNPYAQLRFLQDGLATTHPRLVVIGTDFIEALASAADLAASVRAEGSMDFEHRLHVTNNDRPNRGMPLARIRDLGNTLLSLSALSDSIATVLTQNDPTRRRLTALGFNTASNFPHLVRTEGEYSLFIAKDRQRIADVIPLPKDPQFDVASIGRAITEARTHGAQVIVVITPGYADELEIFRQTGIMDLYQTWLKSLTEVVATAGAGKVPLWDFSGLTPYTTEKLPKRGDTSAQLSWFWETDHFKPALGNLLISRILGEGPSGFGDQLTVASLPQALAKLHEQQRQYVEMHPGAVARVAQLIADRLDSVCRENASRCSHMLADAGQSVAATRFRQDQ